MAIWGSESQPSFRHHDVIRLWFIQKYGSYKPEIKTYNYRVIISIGWDITPIIIVMYPLIFDNVSIFYGASKKYKHSFFGFPKGETEWYIHLPHFICMIFLLNHHYNSISVYPQVNVQILDILVYGRNPASVSEPTCCRVPCPSTVIHSIIVNPMIMGIYYFNEKNIYI